MMRKRLAETAKKMGPRRERSARDPFSADPFAGGGADDGMPDSTEQLEQLAQAFAAERGQLLAERDGLRAELDAVRQQAALSLPPEQLEWHTMQAQLHQAREEREAAREQIEALGAELTQRTEMMQLQQAAQAALKAELAALRDEQSTVFATPPPHAADMAPGGVEAKKGGPLKGWGEKVAAMKAKAAQARKA